MHARISLASVGRSSLLKMLRTCASTVFLGMLTSDLLGRKQASLL
jgi:hypothetical protein